MTSNHDEIKETLPDYLKGVLPEEVSHEIEAHLKVCEDCGREISFLSEIVKIEVPNPGDTFWQTLPRKVRGAVEKEGPRSFSLKSLFFRPLPIAATIAVLVLLVITYTNTKKNDVPDIEPFSSPFTVAVVDYSGIQEKDIPLITEEPAINELYLQSEQFTEHSYYREFSSLSSKEMDSLYEALKKEHRNGG